MPAVPKPRDSASCRPRPHRLPRLRAIEPEHPLVPQEEPIAFSLPQLLSPSEPKGARLLRRPPLHCGTSSIVLETGEGVNGADEPVPRGHAALGIGATDCRCKSRAELATWVRMARRGELSSSQDLRLLELPPETRPTRAASRLTAALSLTPLRADFHGPTR